MWAADTRALERGITDEHSQRQDWCQRGLAVGRQAHDDTGNSGLTGLTMHASPRSHAAHHCMIVLGATGVATRPWHAASSHIGQKVAQEDRDRGSKEAVGLDIKSSSSATPTTGAEIIGSGPGAAADVSVSAKGASSATGVRVEQNGPGTGLRVIQSGPGTGLNIRVTN